MQKKSRKILGILLLVMMGSLLSVSYVLAANEDVFTLDEIVITASRFPEELKEAPVSMEVIDEQEIEEKQAGSVAELLDGVVGLEIRNYGGTAGLKTVKIRGAESEQVLVLVDGQPLNNSQNGLVDLGLLAPEQIKRIEVLRGPASAIYGANALGGVVNIITKESSDTHKSSINMAYGSFNTKRIDFQLQDKEGRLGYSFMARKLTSDGYRENSERDQLNLALKLGYELDNFSDLSASLRYYDATSGVPGSLMMPSPQAKQDDTDTNINIQWQQSRETTDKKVVIYYNKHNNIYDNPGEWGYTGPSEHNTARFGFDFNRTEYLTEQTVTYGLEFKKNKIDSNENGEHDNSNKAIYIQDKLQVKDSLIITLGGRLDDHETYGSEFCPRAGAVYELNDNVNFFASAGKAFRAPTFNELYWPYSETTIYAAGNPWVTEDYISITKGNPDLRPEESTAYEAGLRYIKDKVKGEFSIFQRDIIDMIRWDSGYIDNSSPQLDQEIWYPDNIAAVKTKGFEAGIDYSLTDNISGSASYTYLDSRDQDTDEKIAPAYDFNLAITYTGDGTTASLSSNYIGERPDEMEDYTVVNFRISRDVVVRSRPLKLSLNLNNLFDEEYEVAAGYPMPGRNYTLEVGTEF